LSVHHAVELKIDAIDESIGVQGARNTILRVRMTTHSRLKQNEVVRIARSERKVLRFYRIDGAPQVESGRLQNRSVPGDLNLGRRGPRFQLFIDDGTASRSKVDPCLSQRGKPLRLRTHRITPNREIGRNIKAVGVRIHKTRVPGIQIFHGYGSAGNGRSSWV